MSFTEQGHVGVEVPASCANLGPGFDSLAAAVDLHLVAWTSELTGDRVRSEGEGTEELPTDATNLIWRCFVAYCERFEVPVPDVTLQARSEIPLERGLGSSAAAAVAGAALARAATQGGGSDQDLIDIAGAVEGHSDNAAAAVLGGIVVSTQGAARRFDPARALRPVVCIPKERQSTESARGILPERVSLADAATSGGRAALVLAGLTGGCSFDPGQMIDLLHEPARFSVMPETGKLVGLLREEGYGACLSGAGPTALVIVPARDDAVIDRIGDLSGAAWEVRPTRWDLAGAAVCPPSMSVA